MRKRDEELREWAGVKAGPWWTDAKFSEEEAGCSVLAARTDCGPLPGNPTRGMVAWVSELLPENEELCRATAKHLARCDPQTIGGLIDIALEFDGNIDRLKACEHIADGDEGWETLRNRARHQALPLRLRCFEDTTP